MPQYWRNICLLALVATICIPSEAANKCVVYEHSDCSGGNDIKEGNGSTAEACAASCEATPGCCIGVWGATAKGGHNCYLKSGGVLSIGTKPGNAAFNCSAACSSKPGPPKPPGPAPGPPIGPTPAFEDA